MSANPEAFEFLRKSAYGYVQRHGKDVQALRKHCQDSLDAWLRDEGAGSGLTDSEARNLVDDVSSWVMQKYQRPKPTALRRREERAAQAMLAPMLLEDAAEAYGKATIRNAAKISGQSKTTIARHLRLQGVAPVREKKIEALQAPAKRFVRLLDETFATDGSWLVRMDHCIAKLWDDLDNLSETLPRSTKSTRRKKLLEYLSAITKARIGFNIVVRGDVVAIRRGRRFNGLKDAAVWIEEEQRISGFKLLRSPEAHQRRTRYWDDPWLSDVLAVLFTGTWRTFSNKDQLGPWLRLARPLLDTRPLEALFAVAIDHALQDNFVRDLEALCAGANDPEIRKAARRMAHLVETVQQYSQGWEPLDYFDDVDRELNFMKYLEEHAPDSYAKLAHFRNNILACAAANFEDDPNPIYSTLKRCMAFREEEQAGTWKAPAAEEIASFRPK